MVRGLLAQTHSSKLNLAPEPELPAWCWKDGEGSACCQGGVGYDKTLGPESTSPEVEAGSKATGTRLWSEVPDCFQR